MVFSKTLFALPAAVLLSTAALFVAIVSVSTYSGRSARPLPSRISPRLRSASARRPVGDDNARQHARAEKCPYPYASVTRLCHAFTRPGPLRHLSARRNRGGRPLDPLIGGRSGPTTARNYPPTLWQANRCSGKLARTALSAR